MQREDSTFLFLKAPFAPGTASQTRLMASLQRRGRETVSRVSQDYITRHIPGGKNCLCIPAERIDPPAQESPRCPLSKTKRAVLSLWLAAAQRALCERPLPSWL